LSGDALVAHRKQTNLPMPPELEALVNGVNGRATTHTYTAFAVKELVLSAEERLERAGVKVANRPGTTVTCVSETARSGIANRLVLTRSTVGWLLTAFEKIQIVQRYTGLGREEKISTTITEEAKADIVKNAMHGFEVVKPTIVQNAA